MTPVYEELSAITLIDLEEEAKYKVAKDPMEWVLGGDDIYGDLRHMKLWNSYMCH